MQFYKEINIWQLYGEKLEVAENNDHLGLVVSGFQEELKNKTWVSSVQLGKALF